MDIYTYFTAEQMLTLIGKAQKGGTRGLFKHLKETYPTDYKALVYAFADCMPELVAEDRVYKSGPRKGQRKLLLRDLDVGVDRIVAQELTNTGGWKEFYEVSQYCCEDATMTEVVLTPPENSEQYSKHWIRAFLTRPDFSQVKEHYRNMTLEPIARTQQLVDQWIADNNADVEEIMTWSGAKYNEWHFANMKQVA